MVETSPSSTRSVDAGATGHNRRVAVTVSGVVQGVGFRPFVHRLARKLKLSGWVQNTPQGVAIELEGAAAALEEFLKRLKSEAPPHASLDPLEARWLAPVGISGFEIRASAAGSRPTATVPPDIAICDECLAELLNPADRRFRYPFTNCTHCGPRFTIIESLPYDRPRTTMARFQQCPACLAEYQDPADRRYHAQPNACPVCGPQLALWNPDASVRATHDAALRAAAQAIRDGLVVAVKGLGGFHLLADADRPEAVARLRRGKLRDEKPFAIMVPDLASARALCVISPVEERVLISPEAPIVLLRRNPASPALDGVAPGNPCLGLMLPYTGLHHLLLREVGRPVVATSGNLRDEPICIDEHEAADRLGRIADQLLVHNRPIVRAVDDSVVKVIAGQPVVLRRARGHAPLPIAFPARRDPAVSIVLAVGGHLKNTVALSVAGQIHLSQHVGDLESASALEAHTHAQDDLQAFHQARPDVVVTDQHPGYASTQAAARLGSPIVAVQHHLAHLLSCLVDNALDPPALGIIWDGTGDGGDGTIWGGEFLVAHEFGVEFQRAGSFRTFSLPGGEAAIREPRRAALGLLFELYGDEVWSLAHLPTLRAFTPQELGTLRRMLERGLNSPRTSSVGRLFDALASLLDVRQISRFEGQAAMELEFAAAAAASAEPRFAPTCASVAAAPPFSISDVRPAPENEAGRPGPRRETLLLAPRQLIDWGPWVRYLVDMRSVDTPAASNRRWSLAFHQALAACVTPLAKQVALPIVALSGGCFQNGLLTDLVSHQLTHAGFQAIRHRRVPPNDGGLALGQVAAVTHGARHSNEPPPSCASQFLEKS